MPSHAILDSFDPALLQNRLTQGLPLDYDFIEYGKKDLACTIYSFRIMKGYQPLVSLAFSFEKTGKYSSIDLLEVSPRPDLKSQQVGRKITYNLMSLFADIGIEKVDVSTMNAGSAFWAKCGFIPSSRCWKAVQDALKEEVMNDLDRLSFDNQINVLQSLYRPEPKSIWEITDHYIDTKTGEKLYQASLAETTWIGQFDLSRSDQLQRLRDFVGMAHTSLYPNDKFLKRLHFSKTPSTVLPIHQMRKPQGYRL